MGDGRRTTEPASAPMHGLLLDALERVVETEPGTVLGFGSVCRMVAALVNAPAAGHVRYDVEAGTVHVCLWRDRTPDRSVELSEPGPGPESDDTSRDWWVVSDSRRKLLDRLDQPHLAELPLSNATLCPSLVVVGKSLAFTDADSECLTAARRSLVVLERLAHWVQSVPRPPPHIPRQRSPDDQHAPATALTTREQEVLEMLGEGLMARSIALRLQVSERTVHKHLSNVYRKLDAHDRLLAVRQGELLGLLPQD